MSRTPRIYVDRPLLEGADIDPGERAEKHLVKVLRLRTGAPVTVFDGRGHEHSATLIAPDRATLLRIGPPVDAVPESALGICLIQGISRGERMDLVIQKATELGVTEIRPVTTRRSVVKLDEKRRDRKLDHWRSIAISACEQCGRATLPTLRRPGGLDEALTDLPPDTTRLMLEAHGSPRALVSEADRLVLLVGPEGGLSEAEKKTALAKGFQPFTLGPRVMRTETAALVALAVAQTLWGDFRPRG